MKIRDAVESDAEEVSAVLEELRATGKRRSGGDREFVLSTYISAPAKIKCSVAENEDGSILGFQSLQLATEGNVYGVAPGWGIIGTHVRPSAARRGVGKALFAASRQAAEKAGLEKIDASIPDTNEEGLAYYEAMGFRSYRKPTGTICKCIDLSNKK